MTAARPAEDGRTDLAECAPAEHDQADVSTSDNFNRRRLIRSAAVAGTVIAAGVGLAACASGSPDASGSNGGGQPTGTGNPPTSAGNTSAGGGGSNSTVLGNTTDIPVGEGTIYDSQRVVVTQPVAGTFKGFSAVCTHRGCEVNKVADGLILCPCHGSKFSVADGSVQAGPAPKPLPAANITVQDGKIVLNS